ncbi:MAG: OmpA family protein, partial [Myxococcota bacterium]
MSDASGTNSNDFDSGLKRLWLSSILVALLAALPATAIAQGLPSADELEEQEPEETAEAEEAEEADDGSEDASDEGGDAESAEEAEAADGAEEAEAAEGDDEASADNESTTTSEDGKTVTTTEEEDGTTTTKTVEREMVESEEGDLVDSGLNLEGVRGFQHMASADPGKAPSYSVAFLGEILSGSDLVRTNDEQSYLAGNLLIQGTFLKYFTANLGIGASNNVNTFGRPQSMLAQGDMHLGVRGHYEAKDGYHVALDVTTYFPSSFESSGLGFDGTSVRPRMLFSVDFAEALGPVFGDKPLDLISHFNFGYRFDNTNNLLPEGVSPTRVERFAYDLSAYDYMEFGLGVEYRLPYVSPFASWRLDIPVNGDAGACPSTSPLDCVNEAGFGAFPNILSLGAKAEPVDNLGLTAGLDLGLTNQDVAGVPVTAPWTLILGASWTVDPEPKLERVKTTIEKEKIIEKDPPRGHLVGTVINAESGEAVGGAIIKYQDLNGDTPQATNTTGDFRSYGIAPGKEVTLTVTHPDYKSNKLTQIVENPEDYEVEVKLEPVAKLGIIGGTVIDQDGNPIPEATVTLTGPQERTVTTGATGKFSEKMRAGEYTIAVKKEEYLTGGRDAEVRGDKEVQVEVTLKPEPKEKLVEVKEDRIQINERVYFETGKAKILPRSFNVLDQVASVLLENPQIEKIRVEGHTDDVGADDYNLELSQDRSESVRTYLIEQGISPERLVAKGFGE